MQKAEKFFFIRWMNSMSTLHNIVAQYFIPSFFDNLLAQKIVKVTFIFILRRFCVIWHLFERFESATLIWFQKNCQENILKLGESPGGSVKLGMPNVHQKNSKTSISSKYSSFCSVLQLFFCKSVWLSNVKPKQNNVVHCVLVFC